ncbi:MAG: tRNA (adenosine(37)-N6)-threonylcarbamoyltransferase complex ATPase subunit type 1 TsaE [Pseudomonadota bacterium]|nr:tRNA (adenosine(37)-N6)-threonylcarbamoyltransferase complex ATPase subunit type 1 TsaE [Pseudomonadota bacterium]MDP1904151.1 tRNA (adenosine(37)-N6)-threonylcarbamoyltransferase complex ATPase subunit type 1 TsaE [Pseudomonadota bacterium]MDP2353778.1 tRNA (adenosine(37)-N6)-threonylcarbamoyltransferase complex ATPase subunit type 1 TsaE [Pseudomonadota bacterium]
MSHDGDDSGEFVATLSDDAATQALGARLARVLTPGLSVWLRGDLGAGKTTLTRGLLRELGFSGRVKSPTYTLVELYPFSSFNLYHFDLYRFADPDEWEDAGFREYFNNTSLCLVEWPERGGALLPQPDVQVSLDILDEGRTARVLGLTEEGRQCVAHLYIS